MYCVIYEFTVNPGETERFEKAWGEFTDAIHRVCGSLGSRLHKTDKPNIYVAYAQWPSEEVFSKDMSLSLYSEEELDARSRMKDSLAETKRLYYLEVVDSRLR